MVTAIDHIVIAVRDLAEASADYVSAGFRVTPGGEHTGGATHNALVSFIDGTYFELIALTDPTRGSDHPWFATIDQGDGAIAFALASDDLSAEADRLCQTALVVTGPRDGGRLRPDGQRVDWRSINLASDPTAPLPFVIQDVTPRVLRVPDGIATRHPLGTVHVTGITIVVGDLEAVSPAFVALLGEASSPADRVRRFTAGSQVIDLVQPGDDEPELTSFQHERGDAIYRITLGGSGSQSGGVDLPRATTHGVHIHIEV